MAAASFPNQEILTVSERMQVSGAGTLIKLTLMPYPVSNSRYTCLFFLKQCVSSTVAHIWSNE